MTVIKTIFTETLDQAFYQVGLEMPQKAGKGVIRFSTNGRRGDTAGWLSHFPDGTGAVFGDWRTGDSWCWQQCAPDGKRFDAEEIAALKAKAAEQIKQAEADRESEYQKAAKRAEECLGRCIPASDHPYLERKRIDPCGAFISDDKLVIPVFGQDGIQSLQRIDADGGKKNMPGGRMTNGHFIIGEPTETIVICEGFATGASINKATGLQVIVAFSASNLKAVSKLMRGLHQDAKIVIAGDDDETGIKAAREAAEAVGGSAVFPYHDMTKKDFNDLANESGAGAVRAAIIDQSEALIDSLVEKMKAKRADIGAMINQEPKDLDFFIKDRVIAGRGFLITGLGGSSKTRMLYHLAIGAAIGCMPWDWEVCKTGKAVLFLTEDTKGDVHRTIYHMARALELTPQQVEAVIENLEIHPLAGELFQMLKTQGAELVRTPLFAACVKYIKGLGDVQFIGLDPALSMTQGDELNQGHQRQLGQVCDHMAVLTGAACGMVSHAAKGISSKEDLDSHNSRGGGAITDAVRAEITMRTMTPDEARRARLEDIDDRHNHVQVAVTKANHLPPSAKRGLWLTRAAGGTLLPSEIEIGERAVINNAAALKCLEVLRAQCALAVPKIKAWRDECIANGLVSAKGNTEAAMVKAFQRMVDQLKAAGLVKAGVSYGTYVPADMD